MPKTLWAEAYRPDTLDGYVFQSEKHKKLLAKWVEEGSIPHILMMGLKGTGKTTLAYIIKQIMGVEDADFKEINASDENSIETIRGKVKAFAETMAVGDFKIMLLDECDFLSANAQAALRRITEKYSDNVRFIFTCNHPHKVSDAIRSRCTEMQFTGFDKDEMTVHAFKILKKEGVKIKDDEDIELLKQYVDECHPDMRKLLSTLENNTVDGKLQDYIEFSDMGAKLVNIISQLNDGDWMAVRQGVIETIEDHEWEEIYRFLYDNLDQIEGFKMNSAAWKKAMIIIAQHVWKHGQVADAEINFTSCMIMLSEIAGEG